MTIKKYFGTDGIRGQVGQSNINAEFILKLGWSFGRVLAQEQSAIVLIGKDTRVSGYMIESALQAGLSAAGVHTRLVGPMPTPAIAFLTHSIRATAGIVISASHNAYQDNGIKFFNRDGFKLTDELELEIENYIDSPMRTVASEKLGKAERLDDAPGRYIEFCKSTFPSKLTLKDLKIVIDCANGACYHIAPKILHELGAEIIIISNEPDGFNINKECGSTHTQALQKEVVTRGADLGIALDGDGDRVILIDHTGVSVDGDELLCILAAHRLGHVENGAGVVGTLMSNMGLENALKSLNIPFERTFVGDRYVLEKLQKNNWYLGGESSGHIVDLDFTTTGDGMITALQILKIMQTTGKPLHELKKVMIKLPQTMINVPMFQKIDLLNDVTIKRTLDYAEQLLKGTGRILLRPSGTEPVARVMVEGENEKLIHEIAQLVASEIEKTLQSASNKN